MKIYTRSGDDGETGLFGGSRVAKSNARVAAYGDIDELNAVIGLTLAVDPRDWERDTLVSIQRDLFGIGAQLASPNPEKVLKSLAKAEIPDERIDALEAIIDRTGHVSNVRVLESIPLLDQAAMDAIAQWKYEPTMLNGVPVPIVMTVTVNFALN